MDKHFAARRRGGQGTLKGREDCMEAAPVFQDQTACRKIPPQPPPPPPFLSSFSSLHSLQHNWFSLLQFPSVQENPSLQGEQRLGESLIVSYELVISLSLMLQISLCVCVCAARTELSHYIIPLCIQQETDPCNPLVYYHSPDLPAPDGL